MAYLQRQDALMLRAALEQIQIPQGEGFVWIATEVSVARDLYHYAVETMRHPKLWVKAAGYWSYGEADKGGRIE
jgi:NADPH-dependent ferric siderophore reductase